RAFSAFAEATADPHSLGDGGQAYRARLIRSLAGMTVSDTELASLAASPDIISTGMVADEARRRRHGVRTTFVRVADLPVAARSNAHNGASLPPLAGEIRIIGTPASRAAAVARVAEVAALISAARDVPLSGFSLADLEALSAREG